MDDFTHRGRRGRIATLTLWVLLTCCVITGSLLPINSPVMAAVWRLHVSDKALHFCAYMALSVLPAAGCRNRRNGLASGLSMMGLGAFLEAAQCLSPGRAAELGDMIANGGGVICGVLLGIPFRGLVTTFEGVPHGTPSFRGSSSPVDPKCHTNRG